MGKSKSVKLTHYKEYETISHGRVKLLRYKLESKKKRKVCEAAGNPLDYFFIPENEFIQPEKINMSKNESYKNKMIEKGYTPKLFYIHKDNIFKLQKLKKDDEWNDFINELIEKY